MLRVFREIGPGNVARANLGNAYLYRGIGLSGLGIAREGEFSVLAEGGVDGEHRHLAVVEAVEYYMAPVGTPPECAVVGRPSENLLVIHPGGVSVEDKIAPVAGILNFGPCFNVPDPQVVTPCKCNQRRIGRRSQVVFLRQVLRPGRYGGQQKNRKYYPFHLCKNNDIPPNIIIFED